MAIGTDIAAARQRKGLTQHELAEKLPFCRSSVALHETGRREVNKEDWKYYCQALDDAVFTLKRQRDATGGVYIPYLDGPIVEHNPAALTFLARRELKQAKEHLNEIDVSKPVDMMSGAETSHVERTINELLDAAAAAQTLVIDLCSRLDMSFSKEVKQWQGSLMARQMIARRNV
ncbi:helix-turn-helix domain-containing protein [Halalkalibacterium halodurans]|uniref:HTH cro/C1-type domain-containing protein n=1 Tax=Halalkalibacterium halodurans TaxID=86665 RepID=A0A0M0KM93_ALKHA|nr:helix-turn-helix transcriptional regulator [Halalkalibacterium halodurans]TPE70638.1 helix-turn-helix transcriptional regulator [Halalkalibacterium halodurans]